MATDAPIYDDFDDDYRRTGRSSNWGFSTLKRSIVKNQIKANSKPDPEEKRSWKDISSMKKSLAKLDKVFDTIASGKMTNPRSLLTNGVNSDTNKRREWYIKLRFQQNLIDRLTKLEKTLRTGKSSSLGGLGLLSGLGAIKNLVSSITPSKLTQSLARSFTPLLLGGSGLVLKPLKYLLGLGKRVGSKVLGAGGGFAKRTIGFGRSFLGSMGGKALQIGEKIGLGSITRFLAPRLAATISAGPLAPVVGAGLTAKAVWDYLLPTSWKKYLKYKTAKLYLAAIDKVSQMMEWVGDKFSELKDKFIEYYESAKAKILGALSFVGDLITGEGDARKQVKDYFSNMYNVIENTIGGYIKSFVTMFKTAYDNFIQPFYDSSGNFSIMRGIKYYGKAAYDKGKDLLNQAGEAISESSWNPMNWQKNAESTVKQYEKEQAKKDAQAKDHIESNTVLSKAQDAATKAMSTLNDTLKSTGNSIIGSANASMVGSGSYSSGGGAGTVVGISGNTGVGTGAHLDVRYPTDYAQANGLIDANGKRAAVSNDILSRLSVGGKSLADMTPSSGHGARNIGVGSKYHEGLDFAMPVGSQIVSNYPVKSITKSFDKNGGGYYSTVTFADGKKVNLLHQDASMNGKVGSGGGGELIKGTRAVRNNNPGNLRYASWQAKYGATGGDRNGGKSGMAVFPDYNSGRAAMERMIFESNDGKALGTKGDYGAGVGYRDKTLTQMIAAYAPVEENNTKAYQDYVLSAVGGKNKRMSEYTPQERAAIINAIEVKEGFRKSGGAPLLASNSTQSQSGILDTVDNSASRLYDILTRGSGNTVKAKRESTPIDMPVGADVISSMTSTEISDMIRSNRQVNSMGSLSDSVSTGKGSGNSTSTNPNTNGTITDSISGSSPSDILTRVNFANTRHENAFPQ